jgi:hypothetical protein
MQFLPFACILLVSLTGTDIVQAQLRDDVLRCRDVQDEGRRLACYDAISLSTAAPRSKYEAVPLTDLQAYALSYRGRLVQVTGWVELAGRFLLLKSAAGEAGSLPVDFRNLTRAELQTFQEGCASGCEAIVEGRVGPVNFTTGIVADTLVAR